MKPEAYKKLTQAFLILNAVFWLPWGVINLVSPQALAGALIPNLVVYDLSSAVARVEVRAMYGGLQLAIGCFGILGVWSAQHRASVLLFHVLAMTAMVVCRFAGLVIEGADNYLSFAAQLQPGPVQSIRADGVRVASDDLRMDRAGPAIATAYASSGSRRNADYRNLSVAGRLQLSAAARAPGRTSPASRLLVADHDLHLWEPVVELAKCSE